MVGGEPFATHNYNLNIGSGYPVVQNPVAPLTGTPNGPFFENSRIGPASFTDGMSNTAAITETVRSTASSTYANDPLGVFLVTGNNITTGPPLNSDADYASLCLSLPSYDDAIPGHAGRALALRGARGTACTTISARPTTSSPIAGAACRTAPGRIRSGAGCR